MSPMLIDGDIVIVHCQEDIENGKMAVIAVNYNDTTVKKVCKSPHGMTLVPINPDYNTVAYSHQDIAELPVEIKGKVVELRRKIR